MAAEVVEMNDAESVKQLIESKQPVCIDFYAQWCGPCKAIAPKFKEWAAQYPKMKFIKVDVDKAEELANQYSVEAMPTFIFFKDGKQQQTIMGVDEKSIIANIEKAISA